MPTLRLKDALKFIISLLVIVLIFNMNKVVRKKISNLDNWIIPRSANTNIIHSSYRPRLSIVENVYHQTPISLNLDTHCPVEYTYFYNKHLIKPDPTEGYYKGFIKGKYAAIRHLKQVYGKNVITTGKHDVFGRAKNPKHKKGYMRCNVCCQYPSHFLQKSGLKTVDGTIASKEGRPYAYGPMIDHFSAFPHISAVRESRAVELKEYIKTHPGESRNPADLTQNVLLQNCIEDRGDIYKQRLRHVGMVLNDMRCCSISANTFAGRDAVESHVRHCENLGAGEFVSYIPTEDDCRYSNPTAHKRYREAISDDISKEYVQKIVNNTLAVGVMYDGWRAFWELYIFGGRFVTNDGKIYDVFVGLIDPPDGGAAGCKEAFRIAFQRLFPTEEAFLKFAENIIVSQTTDKAATMTGQYNGSNVMIRVEIIKNPKLPELICATHCGHNSFKDWIDAFSEIGVVISDHDTFVSFTHRGDIHKDFKTYCLEVIFKNASKDDVYTPRKEQSAGVTRMASHLFASMKITHENTDCWLLFLDDRATNHSDTKARFAALDQYRKFLDFKKMRVKYLVMDCLRFYTIFDKSGQIVGIDICELTDIKDSIIMNLRNLKHKYGEFETYFYTQMITHDATGDYVYEYTILRRDDDHLSLIETKKENGLDQIMEGDEIKVIFRITNDDKKQCIWLNLRDDMIDYFIERIEDRCFNHPIIIHIRKFNPKTWKIQLQLIGETKFISEFLNEEIHAISEYWPRIDVECAKIGLVIVKKLWIDLFLNNDKITLSIFGCFIIEKYQTELVMEAVRQLYASMVGLLPTGMVLEFWNSIATLIWSKNRKFTCVKSIHEFINVKVNGPPQYQYDLRRVAMALTAQSRKVSIDVQIHMNQPYLKAFFNSMHQNQQEKLKEIKQLKTANTNAQKIPQNSMIALQKDIKSVKHNSMRNNGYNSETTKYQSNITSYFFNKKLTQTTNETYLDQLFAHVSGNISDKFQQYITENEYDTDSILIEVNDVESNISALFGYRFCKIIFDFSNSILQLQINATPSQTVQDCSNEINETSSYEQDIIMQNYEFIAKFLSYLPYHESYWSGKFVSYNFFIGFHFMRAKYLSIQQYYEFEEHECVVVFTPYQESVFITDVSGSKKYLYITGALRVVESSRHKDLDLDVYLSLTVDELKSLIIRQYTHDALCFRVDIAFAKILTEDSIIHMFYHMTADELAKGNFEKAWELILNENEQQIYVNINGENINENILSQNDENVNKNILSQNDEDMDL
eukprot:357369_1